MFSLNFILKLPQRFRNKLYRTLKAHTTEVMDQAVSSLRGFSIISGGWWAGLEEHSQCFCVLWSLKQNTITFLDGYRRAWGSIPCPALGEAESCPIAVGAFIWDVMSVWKWSWTCHLYVVLWVETLEKEMTTHSSTLAWRITRTEKPGGLQSMGSQRVRHD